MDVDYYPTIKRLLDFTLASAAFIVLSPLFCLIIILIKLDSKGPSFFRQKRLGKNFKPFYLIKFRSMTASERLDCGEFDPGDASRITKVGAFLRKTKLDELPELYNVLKGDMSIIGPRPEVEKYIRIHCEDFKEVLKIRPGLSDYASIKYRYEEEILAGQDKPETYYLRVILPDKLRLARRYVKEISLSTDLRIIKETLKAIP